MLSAEFSIGGAAVGGNAPPFVIAEAGSNFNQSLDLARRLIDVAADAGAAAVKFQLFRSDVIYPEGGEMHDIMKALELCPDWVPVLARHAREREILFLASAFDTASVDVLEDVGVPAHKIASSEATNIPLLHYVATRGKPLIISTGMCDMIDVGESIAIASAAGSSCVALLQCGAVYPLPPQSAQLRVLTTYRQQFGCPVGFSDHTLGNAAAITAIGLGATIFEKHITLDRTADGPDHAYALEPAALGEYIVQLTEGHAALGCGRKELLPEERLTGRREGVYAARDLLVGETIRADDLIIRRPARGMRGRYAGLLIGSRISRAVSQDEPVTWSAVSFAREETT